MSRRDQQLRHEPRARAAAVLHAREDRLDGGHLLRVVGHTDYHFLTVAECSRTSVEPGARARVRHRGPTDFDLCVQHLQMLGVRYYMAWTPEMQKLPPTQPDLTLVANRPRPSTAPAPDKELKDWKVYEVATAISSSADQSRSCSRRCRAAGAKYSKCWGEPWTDTGAEPELQDGGSARPRRGG